MERTYFNSVSLAYPGQMLGSRVDGSARLLIFMIVLHGYKRVMF